MVAITVIREDLETLFVRLQITGLQTDARYDLFRLQMRYEGDDPDTGLPEYSRELPDRRGLWFAVGHRMGWLPSATTVSVRDFECPRRPIKYFIVRSLAGGPHEWDFSDGRYPTSRGVLDDEIIHFNRDLREANLRVEPSDNHLLVRSTAELGLYVSCCVVEMDGPTYTARGQEHAVMGSQYPVYVADSREARRGRVTLLTRDLGDYNDLRRIVFPASGRIRPIIFNSNGDSTLLLDDMRVVPLDVRVEQALPADPDLRYVHIDYIEDDPSTPLVQRIGDNEDLTVAPTADFSISDATPAVGQTITLTDTSTGQGDDWDWTLPKGTQIKIGKVYRRGPLKVAWRSRGKKYVKLRFGGSGQGYHTRTKTIEVH